MVTPRRGPAKSLRQMSFKLFDLSFEAIPRPMPSRPAVRVWSTIRDPSSDTIPEALHE